MAAEKLIVCEVFKSIQGETSYAGLPCGFVRTAGCNLECSWCDTEYARSGEGRDRGTESVARELGAFGTRLVCITGGEPLLQTDAVVALSKRLLQDGHTVLVETNGTQDISPLPRGAVRIMDVKCPGSGESGKTLPRNLELLRPQDEVKFVISDREDFEWAVEFIDRHALGEGPEVLFAPVWGRLEGRRLAQWILRAGLEVRLQLQLHKFLWPERERGV